jgi:hypothetical protein
MVCLSHGRTFQENIVTGTAVNGVAKQYTLFGGCSLA